MDGGSFNLSIFDNSNLCNHVILKALGQDLGP